MKEPRKSPPAKPQSKPEDKLDEELEELFPASDPPSNTPTAAGGPEVADEPSQARQVAPTGLMRGVAAIAVLAPYGTRVRPRL